MKYIFLIYTEESAMEYATREEAESVKAAHWAVIEDAQRLGIFHAAQPLKPTATATTVRVQQGRIVTLDGPFAETKEQLAGYYILDCKDLDEAIEWAARIPTNCRGKGGCIEIRPFDQVPPKPDVAPAGALNARS